MPKKLLLADDSITIQKVIGITFANEDFALTTVDNGVDAIATARRLRPDLILADVVMPGKNGYEVCEFVKHDPELRGIPVLLLAGTFESFDEAEMARVGADGYITKPFESQTLIDKVHELISRTQKARGAAGAGAPPAAGAAEEFNLDDFSPFEEVSPSDAEAPGEAPVAAAGGWDAGREADAGQAGGEEDVWDLSDFEPGAEESTEAPVEEAGDEPAAEDPSMVGIEGEQTFDFSEGEPEPLEPVEDGGEFDLASATDAFEPEAEATGAQATDGADDFGGDDFSDEFPADDTPELTEFDEITDEAPAGAAEAGADPFVEPEAADGWAVAAPAAALRRPGAPVGSESARRADVAAAPAGPMGALATRVKAVADGIAAELDASRVGLPAEQVEAIVARIAREVIEEVAWEVVPDLCEQIIRAEIRKVTGK
jgi:CheY-like chemotaxis protein